MANLTSEFCVCPSFPFGIEVGMWDMIVLISNHCLSIYFVALFFFSEALWQI